MTPAAPMSDEQRNSGTRRLHTEGPGGESRVASERQAQALCDDILRPDRVYPIVGLSCQFRSPRPPLSPNRVREVIWDTVPIYIIESRESRLLDGLLDGLGAYNGAARVWFPGADKDSEAQWHPLIYDSTGAYGEEAIERLAAVFAHRPPESAEQLSPQEQTVLQLRSLPRPDTPEAQRSASVIPLSTRKDLRRLTTDLRGDRNYPIVVLTLEDSADGPAFAPAAISSRIDPHIPVYVLATTDLCRRLAQALGRQLAVEGGDARILWPGAREGSDPAEHPLVPKSSNDPGNPVDRLIAALELSRPGVRGHVAALEQRLQRAEQQAAGTLRELRDARREYRDVLGRAEAAEQARDATADKLAALDEAGLDHAELELIAGMDTDGRLHRLISREWLKALTTAADRETYPLKYVFGAAFVRSVSELTGTSLQRIAWVGAMVACDRARKMPGVDPHQLREGPAGSAEQLVRPDGAKAWRCKLNGEGASRLHYWARPDGLIEFASVGVHDAIGQVA